jgi:hypothetical protein
LELVPAPLANDLDGALLDSGGKGTAAVDLEAEWYEMFFF